MTPFDRPKSNARTAPAAATTAASSPPPTPTTNARYASTAPPRRDWARGPSAPPTGSVSRVDSCRSSPPARAAAATAPRRSPPDEHQDARRRGRFPGRDRTEPAHPHRTRPRQPEALPGGPAFGALRAGHLLQQHPDDDPASRDAGVHLLRHGGAGVLLRRARHTSNPCV